MPEPWLKTLDNVLGVPQIALDFRPQSVHPSRKSWAQRFAYSTLDDFDFDERRPSRHALREYNMNSDKVLEPIGPKDPFGAFEATSTCGAQAQYVGEGEYCDRDSFNFDDDIEQVPTLRDAVLPTMRVQRYSSLSPDFQLRDREPSPPIPVNARHSTTSNFTKLKVKARSVCHLRSSKRMPVIKDWF